MKKLVLVVDDSGLMLRNVKSLIESKYQVNVVSSGKKSIDKYGEKTSGFSIVRLRYAGLGWKTNLRKDS